jgi:putative endonuclease
MAIYVVYMLFCDNNSYYTGYTNDLARRYKAHLEGKCKYTRSFKPLRIAQSWSLNGEKGDALRVERYIKSLSRLKKEALLLSPHKIQAHFLDITFAQLHKEVTTTL